MEHLDTKVDIVLNLWME